MPSFTVFKGSKEGKIVESQTTKPDLENDQVLVKVTASGLCGTDIHFAKADMVLGHEGAGVVEATGPNVKYLKKGDRVGWGYQHNSCGHCEYCLTGRETFCEEREFYGEANLDQGSFASHGVWHESFLFQIPDSMTDAEAAPLMCGGATVFNALRMYDIKPTERVGIMGVGGLGHLAIQFASKMGCEVVVFSGSDSKKEEALKLGATEFVAMKGKKELKLSHKINRLLVTTSALPDWNLMLPVLARDSIVLPLTVSGDDFSFPTMGMVVGGIRIQGSVVSARQYHREMLKFAAMHNIKPMLNEFPLTAEGIHEAIDTLNSGKMRYRGVLIPQN